MVLCFDFRAYLLSQGLVVFCLISGECLACWVVFLVGELVLLFFRFGRTR